MTIIYRRHRILLEKNNFDKGYKQNWSDDIYIITKKLQSNGVCWFQLADLRRGQYFTLFKFSRLNVIPISGNEKSGVFYSNQLNLVATTDETYNHNE